MNEEENPFAASVANREEQYTPPLPEPLVLPPQPELKQTKPKDENPFAVNIRQREETGDQSQTGLGERFAINSRYNFYTGTLAGSGLTALYKSVIDDPTADEANRKKAQGLYDGVRNDLARYALMKGYSGGLEGAVAFAGQLFGGLGSPESYIVGPGLRLGAGIASRIGSAMVTQGAINAATDPAVQALSMRAGIQKDFSLARIGAAAGIGAVTGGVLQGAGEAIKAGAQKFAKPELPPLPTDAEVAAHLDAEAKAATATRLDLAQEDPALLAVGETAAPREAAKEVTPETIAAAPEDAALTTDVMAPDATLRAMTPEEEAAGKALQPGTEGAQQIKEGATAPETVPLAEQPTLEPAVQFRKKAGEPGAPGAEEVAADAAPNERQILSLQDQVLKLADAIGHPVFQGRMRGGSDVLGQLSQGVARLRSITDIASAVHESAHYINEKSGQPLTDLITTHAGELEQFAPSAGGEGAKEGYAEFVSKYVTAPGWTAKQAPEFAKAFDDFLVKEQPEIFTALQDARQSFRDYLAAPTAQKLSAIVKTSRPDGAIAELRKIGLPSTVGNVMRWLNNSFLDRQSAFPQAARALSRMAKDSGGELPDIRGSNNPEILARQINSAHNAADAGFRDGVYPYKSIRPEGPGLRGAISWALGAPRGLAKWAPEAIKDFSDYLVARRGEYKWRKFENGDMPHRPMNMSHEELIAEIAAKEAANPQYRQAAQMVHEYTRQLLRKQYEAGHLPGGRETYEKLLKEEFYVPFYRIMDDKPGDVGSGPSLDAQGQMKIKRQVGSDRDIINPLESLMTQAFLLEKKIARSEVIKSFDNLGRIARDAGAIDTGRIIEEIPVNEIVGTRFDLRNNIKIAAGKAAIDEDDTKVLLGVVSDMFGDDPILGTMYHSEPTKPRGEPILFDMVGGELRAYRFTSGKQGIALFEAISELSPALRQKYDDIALAIGEGVSGVLRGGVTTNPAYALANFLRDQPAAFILTRGFVPFWSGIKGIGHDMLQTDMAKLYAYSGGISPGAAAFQVDDVIQKDISALARKGWLVQRLGAFKDLKEGNIKGAWRAWAETIGVAETGTRIAIFENSYKRAKKQGLSDYDAMFEAAATAKDFLDFGRHGSKTESMRLMITFINAWAQGSSKAARTLFQPLLRSPVTVAEKEAQRYAPIAIGKVALTGLAGYTYSKFMMDHEAYRDALPETRAANVVIPGEFVGKSSGEMAVWPKPWELGIGWNIGEMLAQKERGDERANDYFWRGIWEVIAPPVLVPNVFKLPLELALNKSYFTGREITPSDVQQRVTADAKASTMAKQVAKVTGWSPLKVDYAIGAGFGNWGRDMLALSNATDPNKPAAALDEAVGIRRFIKKAFGGYNEMIRQWWDMAGERNGTYATAKAEAEDLIKRDPVKAQDFIAKLPDNQRVYVTMMESAGATGKAQYGPDQRRLHPLTRAGDAVSAINAYQTELNQNLQIQFATGKRVEMDPAKRRVVIDALDNLKRFEIRNALVMLKEPGFTDRKIEPIVGQWQALRDVDPKAADEVATRYAEKKIVPEATVSRMWPELKRRVLQGDVASVKAMSIDAKYTAGYEFKAARVKAPPKPLIKIPPAQFAQPAALPQ